MKLVSHLAGTLGTFAFVYDEIASWQPKITFHRVKVYRIKPQVTLSDPTHTKTRNVALSYGSLNVGKLATSHTKLFTQR